MQWRSLLLSYESGKICLDSSESAAEPPAPGSGVYEKQRSAGRHAPRVDAPTVDGRPGQAIAEE